jgi:hypothetical protein
MIIKNQSFDLIKNKNKEISIVIFENKFNKKNVEFKIIKSSKSLRIKYIDGIVLFENISREIFKNIKNEEKLEIVELNKSNLPLLYIIKKTS